MMGGPFRRRRRLRKIAPTWWRLVIHRENPPLVEADRDSSALDARWRRKRRAANVLTAGFL